MFWFLLSPIAEIRPICNATLPALMKLLYVAKDLFFKLTFFLELQVSLESTNERLWCTPSVFSFPFSFLSFASSFFTHHHYLHPSQSQILSHCHHCCLHFYSPSPLLFFDFFDDYMQWSDSWMIVVIEYAIPSEHR